MRLDHPGLTNEQVVEQVLGTKENDKRVAVIEDTGRKLLHKSPIAEALERAVIEAARREMRQAS
jgi:hypothetical protein